jgi:hypothetical protein
MTRTFSHTHIRHNHLVPEAHAALALAELLVDRPWTRRGSLWLDAMRILVESVEE